MAAFVLATGFARTAAAQASTLSLSSATLTVATPAIADYQAGYICAGSITATMSKSTGGNRTDTIFVRALASISGGTPSTKPLSDFQWTTSAAGCVAGSTWNSITTLPALVTSGKYNTSIAATVYFRFLLSWTGDQAPGSLTVPDIQFLLNRPSANPPVP